MPERTLQLTLLATLLLGALAALPPPSTSSSSSSSPSSGESYECRSDSIDANALLCRGTRALRNVLRNLRRSARPLVLVRGLEIVPLEDPPTTTAYDQAADDSFLGGLADYLRTHELNIKFSDLLADEAARQAALDVERDDVEGAGDHVEEARKKDKGQGLLLAMSVMFGKMLAVMGLGGIGALAMKALGVAMAALMMAGLVGLKSLSQGQGHETSSVQYVTAEGGHHHHKRRRRRGVTEDDAAAGPATSWTLPYRGWHPAMMPSK